MKAVITAANNTVMSYAGQSGIVDAFMNQDLVVAYENFITPRRSSPTSCSGRHVGREDALRPAYDVAPLFSAAQALAIPSENARAGTA